MAKQPKSKKEIDVEALKHKAAKRRNIPTAELETAMQPEDRNPVPVVYERRNRDLDPQLVWRGKDEQDWSDLIVTAPPLYIQEKVHPKALIDDLHHETRLRAEQKAPPKLDLFADFNGLPDREAATEFYQHDLHWSNRMILGDSLSVMASMAEREHLRGQVQCIYFDPPYGIKFNSNFQWSTTSRDVKDGSKDHITREPEQVKAFRDTWRDGIHSYLTYLRDRLTVARDLLSNSGSIFVQIGDENVHRVRALLDEVFGDENFVAQITFRVKSPLSVSDLARTTDFLVWYSKEKGAMKFRQPRLQKSLDGHPEFTSALLEGGFALSRGDAEKQEKAYRLFTAQNLGSSGYTPSCMFNFNVEGREFTHPKGKSWKTNLEGMTRLKKAGRLQPLKTSLRWRYFFDDAPSEVVADIWTDTFAAADKTYVVQTSEAVIQRCILMTTDPGDLVVDPTCGSGTTAYVSEQWGRRWITIDTSRVALALARSRIMGARYPYYLLADSREGQVKEGEVTRSVPKEAPTHGDIRQGFVYERVPHITLKSIANNAEIDVIWDKWQQILEPLRTDLNAALKKSWQEWEIPREADEKWLAKAKDLHSRWWAARIGRQREVDASIAAKAELEYLYDKPYVDSARVRVAGPFTVESLSPHRMIVGDSDDELIDEIEAAEGKRKAPGYKDDEHDFARMILENLRVAGVQQADKADRIAFTSLTGWPGEFICAEGKYMEAGKERRAGIFIGPEFGTVARPDLVAAVREAADAGFDVLIGCAFNYDAHSAELQKIGRIPVLKARMNPDLHMGRELKTTGSGNLFVVFGEPDIEIEPVGKAQIQVRIKGVDIFKPQTGEVETADTDNIALWMLDTDYNEESFFVRHAYFLGANDPYKALKMTLKAEIDREAWESLNSDVSRPFDKPKTGRIAVKVINHLGDEVMKVYAVK